MGAVGGRAYRPGRAGGGPCGGAPAGGVPRPRRSRPARTRRNVSGSVRHRWESTPALSCGGERRCSRSAGGTGPAGRVVGACPTGRRGSGSSGGSVDTAAGDGAGPRVGHAVGGAAIAAGARRRCRGRDRALRQATGERASHRVGPRRCRGCRPRSGRQRCRHGRRDRSVGRPGCGPRGGRRQGRGGPCRRRGRGRHSGEAPPGEGEVAAVPVDPQVDPGAAGRGAVDRPQEVVGGVRGDDDVLEGEPPVRRHPARAPAPAEHRACGAPVGADLGKEVPALVEEARVDEAGEVTQGLEGRRGRERHRGRRDHRGRGGSGGVPSAGRRSRRLRDHESLSLASRYGHEPRVLVHGEQSTEQESAQSG